MFEEFIQALHNFFGNDNPDMRVNIYSPSGILMHRTHGNFKQVCEANNLPFYALRRTYTHDTEIYNLNRPEYKQYKGWYARVVEAEATEATESDEPDHKSGLVFPRQ